MQTILGANGIIATETAKELTRFTKNIRLVSRHPRKVNESDEIFSADLLNQQEVLEAVKGSEIVYLVAGVTYQKKIWQEQWPVIMNNVVTACKKHNAKLVFFDNIYMYGRVNGMMTEELPYRPCSIKGKVRAGIANLILEEIKKGTLTAMIVRAPEFYGPGKTQSVVNAMVFDAINKGKKPMWLLNDSFKRTWIYTPDAGKATALLGNTPAAYNQTWHLPVNSEFPTGKEFFSLISSVYGKEIKYSVLSKWMLKIASLFIPDVRELMEMLYQFEQDYLFDSSKFRKKFPDFTITTYLEGIREIQKEASIKK